MTQKRKLAIVTTHPIQYNAPLFKLLATRGNIELKVFYTWGKQAIGKIFDPGFGEEREWDIPLFEGYNYEFVNNISPDPGSHRFNGIINPGLIPTIEAYNPDAILVFGWNFNSHLKAMRYFEGKVLVLFRGDSTLIDETPGLSIKKIAKRLFLRWVYSHIDYALYVGANNKEYYKAHGVKGSKLVYAPHAIDNGRFQQDYNEKEEQALKWKELLGIPESKPVVIFAGKLEQKKNPLLLVEAAKLLPEMHYVIIGNGVLENEVKAKSKNVSNITLLPFQNQGKMAIAYRLGDIFVLPSQGPGETWGLAINEAMACGRIVIASRKCGGAIDLIEEGKNGFIFNPDVHSLVKVLHLLGNDKKCYSTYKNESSKRVNNFSYKHIAEAIEICFI